MRLLLDTSVFLRWMAGTPIPRRVGQLIDKPGNEKVVSIVTPWEIAIKPKLNFSVAEVATAIAAMGASVLPVQFSHIDALHSMPAYDHRDPFDRMLIAQALAEDLPIVSSDRRFTEYKKLRVIWD